MTELLPTAVSAISRMHNRSHFTLTPLAAGTAGTGAVHGDDGCVSGGTLTATQQLSRTCRSDVYDVEIAVVAAPTSTGAGRSVVTVFDPTGG